jgi:hypothetical protein
MTPDTFHTAEPAAGPEHITIEITVGSGSGVTISCAAASPPPGDEHIAGLVSDSDEFTSVPAAAAPAVDTNGHSTLVG